MSNQLIPKGGNDCVQTPIELARDIVNHFKPNGKMLEPCKGAGNFLSALPIDYVITLGHYAKYIAQGMSLIKNKAREVHSVDNVNDLIEILKKIIVRNSVISVKGLGNVVFHRIKSLIEKQNLK